MALQFHKRFLFRTPCFPFLWSDPVQTVVTQKKFQEAIYLASPSLYDEMQKWINGQLKDEKAIEKLIYSLDKYLKRIRTRSTPFGLFASCSTGHWGETSEIFLNEELSPKTRFDMDFACVLARHIMKNPKIKSHLLFFPNSSLYKHGNQHRYIEFTYFRNRRKYNISSVDTSSYLQTILAMASRGAKVETLANAITNKEINFTEAIAFIDECIENQVLVSNLEPSVTGDELMLRIYRVIEKVKPEDAAEIILLLEKINMSLNEIDKNNRDNVELYREIFNTLQRLEIDVDEKFLFQVDCFRGCKVATISTSFQKKILQSIEFLEKITSPYVNNELSVFKKTFSDTYEDREMPLSHVLDPESGIGYPTKDIHGINHLVDDLFLMLPENSNLIQWDIKSEFLFKKVLEAIEHKKNVIELTDEDLMRFSNAPKKERNLPITFSVLFKIINNNKIFLKLIGGSSSAASMLGRFGHGEENISQMLKEIKDFEHQKLEDKVIAEIVHLPEDRAGNILFRPILSRYEIPYLAKSNLEPENQIGLEDIMISIKNDRFFLRSKKLNTEIIPFLSSAHNYKINSMPVYRFICDLQLQDIVKPALYFSWGALVHMFKFLPRLEYKDVILSPATWNLPSTDFLKLCSGIDSEDLINEISTWRKKWKMPKYVNLKDNDNELIVDLEDELSVRTFLSTIKKRSAIELNEFIFEPENAIVKDAEGNPYAHEIIAVIFNHEYKSASSPMQPALKQDNRGQLDIKRTFIPGSEWLYYKIYCGVKTADNILADTIKPMVELLMQKGLIQKWFFIRYSDPDFHIRLRFFNSEASKTREIIPEMFQFLSPLLEHGIISKVLTDTYVRELERYGRNTMELTESYFGIESIVALHLLSFTKSDADEEKRWLFALRSVDELLDNFHFKEEKKLSFIETLKNGFIAEHGGHKNLKVQLDNKFRKLRPKLTGFLNKTNDGDPNIKPLIQLLQWKKTQTEPIIEQILSIRNDGVLMTDLHKLISSYTHMMLNRLFKSRQRTYEMVIYDMLYKYYRSEIAKNKNITTGKLIIQ